ncbi:MAG: SRPBCC family protein [Solirubrobacteraceae bacterium]
MEQLPYIDEHSITIDVTRERVWSVLAQALRRHFGGSASAPLTRLLGVAPAEARGNWRETVHTGDTLPGFAVAETRPPERLELRGRHRFSSYTLIFELDAIGAARCTLRAQTWAEFPGPVGRVYRAFVIGSGGHRLILKRLLRNVARHA